MLVCLHEWSDKGGKLGKSSSLVDPHLLKRNKKSTVSGVAQSLPCCCLSGSRSVSGTRDPGGTRFPGKVNLSACPPFLLVRTLISATAANLCWHQTPVSSDSNIDWRPAILQESSSTRLGLLCGLGSYQTPVLSGVQMTTTELTELSCLNHL